MKKTLGYIGVALFVLLWLAPIAFGQSAPPTSGTAATVTAVDTTNGLSLSNGTVSLAAAGAAANGAVTTGTQTFAGAKTFSSAITTTSAGLALQSTSASNTFSLTETSSVWRRAGGTFPTFSVNEAGGGSAQVYNGAGTQGLEVTSTYVNLYGTTIRTTTGIRLNTAAAAEPTCDSSNRGTIWYTASAGGVADKMQVCAKSAADAYAWRSMATIP